MSLLGSLPEGRTLPALCALAAGICLLHGWAIPAFSVTRLWVFTDTVTIVDGVRRLWQEGDLVLALVIGVFSLLVPTLKLTVIAWALARPRSTRAGRGIGWVGHLSRWSMLDVLVVAVLVVTAHTTVLADVAVHAGLYWFAASVLLTCVAASRTEALRANPLP